MTKLDSLLKEKEALFKKKQELYSWNWFYMDSYNNLYTRRYKKIKSTNENGSESIYDVSIKDKFNEHYGKPLDYSQRIKTDLIMSEKISKEIDEVVKLISINFEEINKEYKNKKRR